MNRQEIINALVENHKTFLDFMDSLNDEQFLSARNDKWAAGQQLDHIYRSVKPLTLALWLPKFFLRLLFGKANRDSKTNEALITKYLDKLENGGRASGRFVPQNVQPGEKGKLIKSLSRTVSNLTSLLNKYSEEELDKFVLPHPLLGKLTLREMMYFTIYHVQHHLKLSRNNLNN